MRAVSFALALAALAGACGTDEVADDAATTVPTVTDPDEETTGPPRSTEPATTAGAGSTTPPPPTAPASPPPLSATSLPPEHTAAGFPVDPALPAVTAAVADLAARLGVDPAAVSVVDARAVTWPDTSFGCPEPGVGYLQVLTDGLLVVLDAGGHRYDYHGGDPLALCENPQPPTGG